MNRIIIDDNSLESLKKARRLLDDVKGPQEYTEKSLSFLNLISDAQFSLSNALGLVQDSKRDAP